MAQPMRGYFVLLFAMLLGAGILSYRLSSTIDLKRTTGALILPPEGPLEDDDTSPCYARYSPQIRECGSLLAFAPSTAAAYRLEVMSTPQSCTRNCSSRHHHRVRRDERQSHTVRFARVHHEKSRVTAADMGRQ